MSSLCLNNIMSRTIKNNNKYKTTIRNSRVNKLQRTSILQPTAEILDGIRRTKQIINNNVNISLTQEQLKTVEGDIVKAYFKNPQLYQNI